MSTERVSNHAGPDTTPFQKINENSSKVSKGRPIWELLRNASLDPVSPLQNLKGKSLLVCLPLSAVSWHHSHSSC